MARTPTSAPGSEPRPRGRAARGFTLVELLVVLVLIAVAASTAALALRDGDDTRLDREAARLAALLEAARAEARASGVAVRFQLDEGGAGFRWIGLPPRLRPPAGWQTEGLRAHLAAPPGASAGTARAIVLGPEPLIGAQRIVLTLGTRQLALATDGLAPFSVQAAEAATAEAGAAPSPAR